jgi:hypothetical protein
MPPQSEFFAIEPKNKFLKVKIKLTLLHHPMMGAHQSSACFPNKYLHACTPA